MRLESAFVCPRVTKKQSSNNEEHVSLYCHYSELPKMANQIVAATLVKILKMVKNIFPLLLAIVLLHSCASSYRQINPDTFQNYASDIQSDGTTVSYKYNVLSATGNKKYAKRENKRGITLLAVKVENNSGQAIDFKRNIRISSNGEIVLPIESEILFKQLKQPAAIYLLYSLLWFTYSNCTNGDCDNLYLPIGIPIGAGNALMASSANDKFKQELAQFNILKKMINPGETVYGLIGVRHNDYAPLKFEVVE